MEQFAGNKFQIVVYPSQDDDGGAYTAHCLNMDLVADDDTVEGAVSRLLETIEAAIEASQKHNADAFRSAPKEYWEMLARAIKLPRELMERIVFHANKRHAAASKKLVDVETQCDLRQLQVA